MTSLFICFFLLSKSENIGLSIWEARFEYIAPSRGNCFVFRKGRLRRWKLEHPSWLLNFAFYSGYSPVSSQTDPHNDPSVFLFMIYGWFGLGCLFNVICILCIDFASLSMDWMGTWGLFLVLRYDTSDNGAIIDCISKHSNVYHLLETTILA